MLYINYMRKTHSFDDLGISFQPEHQPKEENQVYLRKSVQVFTKNSAVLYEYVIDQYY